MGVTKLLTIKTIPNFLKSKTTNASKKLINDLTKDIFV